MQTKKYSCHSTINRFVYSKYPTTIGDEFNCVDNPALDRTSYDAHNLNSFKSQNSISLCQTFDVHDTLRITNANSSHFTWHGSAIASRLDRFYAVNVNLCEVQAVAVSDQPFFHISIIIQQNQYFGPDFWKNNVSLYEDPSFYDYIVPHWNK